MKERRGRACKASGSNKGRSPKLDRKTGEALIGENQRLRMEIEYLKTECLSYCGRAKERQKAFIIAELRQKYPLKDLLELSGIARSTYYYYLKQKDKDKYQSEKQNILEIYNVHKGRNGYRRICSVLKAKGYTINHKTVLKFMKESHFRGKQRKSSKYHSYNGEPLGHKTGAVSL